MAEILSQKEIDALLETISEGSSEERKEGEEKEKINPGAESPEYLEKREKVKTLLHDFYQERQKNMPVHREIRELAEKLKSVFEKVGLFFNKFYESENKVGENFCSHEGLPNRTEIIINWKQEEKSGWGKINVIITDLQNILDKKGFNKELSEKEEKEISDLIKNIQEIDNKLNENVKKLWEIRKNIANQFLGLPKFTEWRDAKFETNFNDEGLYNLDSCVGVRNILETEKGREEKILFFKTNNRDIEKALKNLTGKFNITEQELNEIKDLEWSGEEKEKLKRFRKEVENYTEKSVEIAKSFFGIEKTFEFDGEGAENIRIEMTRAFIRGRYKENGLPAVHKARVVQEIMNGAFKWPE